MNEVTDESKQISITGLLDACDRALSAAGLKLERQFLQRLLAALLTKRFVLLSGLAGSGKTKVAQALARWFSTSASSEDPFTVGAVIPSDRVKYAVTNADGISVEFSNDGTRVLLARQQIEEWVETMKSHGFSEDTPARKIREAVNETSQYSSQLNSFETHLKSAALSLIKARASSTGVVGSNFAVVAVGADWTSNEAIMGYPDGLDQSRYIRTPALDLILRAHTRPDEPHFLVLDEMNLSHVERYFADFLSSIESGEPLRLFSAESSHPLRSGVPASLHLPANLFVIGTVNVDETTYMFSPKVLDRANVLEFRVETAELLAFLDEPRAVDLSVLDRGGAKFGARFVALSSQFPTTKTSPTLRRELGLLFSVLQEAESEFGFRVAKEISSFMHWHRVVGGKDQFEEALDAQILQKLLPKLHGSRQQLEPTLAALISLCGPRDSNEDEVLARARRAATLEADVETQVGTPTYPLSLKKLQRMMRRLRLNGFASFSEA